MNLTQNGAAGYLNTMGGGYAHQSFNISLAEKIINNCHDILLILYRHLKFQYQPALYSNRALNMMEFN